jgi:hypothetical protein
MFPTSRFEEKHGNASDYSKIDSFVIKDEPRKWQSVEDMVEDLLSNRFQRRKRSNTRVCENDIRTPLLLFDRRL